MGPCSSKLSSNPLLRGAVELARTVAHCSSIVSLQLERPTKQMREAEERLKAIPQFCFPDAKDWLPVSEYNR